MAVATAPGGPATGSGAGGGGRGRPRPVVLATLILVAAVANLNLTIATVALPAVGRAFSATQSAVDGIAVGYSLGLAASVLYLGALGDRYGRKLMLVLGNALAVPACLAAAYAPDVAVLMLARLAGGLAAGMAYPTTLALITALWPASARAHAIALWSAIGGASSALGPLIGGLLLESFWWGSVFLITLPLALAAVAMVVVYMPAHVNESSGGVDHAGGGLSIVVVGSLVLAINLAPVPGRLSGCLVLGLIGLVGAAGFVVRQRRAANPLYDLHVAGRRVFWVAAVGGIIVFGALMGALFVGQQYLQDVLGYSPWQSGAAILPVAVLMVLVAPRSAWLIVRYGSRVTLLTGYLACLLGFAVMLVLWRQGTPYWQVGLAYALVGTGVGLAGTPASHALTGSVPVHRAGMASGTADLQRDLGGAVMQSILGGLLTAGYATSFGKAIAAAPHRNQIGASVQNDLEKSFTGAAAVAQRYPQYSSKIEEAARDAFLAGDRWAYTAGIVAVVLGAVLVFFRFPHQGREAELLAAYQREDTAKTAQGGPSGPP